MNVNDIHNAMNQIDDDMLESVDALRKKHNDNNLGSHKQAWIHVLPLVACLFIIASIAILPKLADNLGNNDTADEEMDMSFNVGDIITSNDSSNRSTNSSDFASSECPSVIVEIIKWNGDSFIGKVTKMVDTDVFNIGASVTVRFEPNVCIAHEYNNEIKYEQTIPNETIYPVGSTVCVQFSYSNVSDFSGHTIYATILMKIVETKE